MAIRTFGWKEWWKSVLRWSFHSVVKYREMTDYCFSIAALPQFPLKRRLRINRVMIYILLVSRNGCSRRTMVENCLNGRGDTIHSFLQAGGKMNGRASKPLSAAECASKGSKRTSGCCERASEPTNEWPSTYMWFYGSPKPLCVSSITNGEWQD